MQPNLYEKHSPGSYFRPEFMPSRGRRPTQCNWSSGAAAVYSLQGPSDESRARAADPAVDPGSSKMNLYRSFKGLSGSSPCCHCQGQSCSCSDVLLFAVLWVLASDPDAQGESPRAPPLPGPACAPEMRNSAKGYQRASAYLLGLDVHYVRERREILCCLWMKIQCMLWICWFETLKIFH